MGSDRHQPADGGEALEVVALAGEERVPLEVREDALEEVLEPPRLPLDGAVAPVRPDASAPEVRLDRKEHLGPIPVLTDREARPHLPTRQERRPWRDRDREAAFPVDIAGDVDREELATVQRAGV